VTRTGALVISLVAFAALCTAAGLAILASSFALPVPDSWGFRGFPAIFAVTFTWVGAVLAWRRPRNAIGWLLLAAGVMSALQVVLGEYASFGTIGRLTPLSGAVFAAWVVSWIWVFLVTLVAVFLPLLFPDGHFLSRRWRAAAWLGAVTAILIALTIGFSSGPLNNAAYADNPYGLLVTSDTSLPLIGVTLLGLAAVAAAASLFVRYHRSRGTERQQLKWLAFEAIVLSLAVLIGSGPNQGAKWPSVLLIGALALAPIMIGIAVLRYRLYDIDVLINRALVYGATTAGIAIAFLAGILILQSLLRPIMSGSEVAVAISTLASVALFQPLRGRVQRTVDRRFYRSRYDAARTLDDFRARLRDEVDLDAVRADLVSAVRDTVQPAHASLWLRPE
jgi:hypothetical protein